MQIQLGLIVDISNLQFWLAGLTLDDIFIQLMMETMTIQTYGTYIWRLGRLIHQLTCLILIYKGDEEHAHFPSAVSKEQKQQNNPGQLIIYNVAKCSCKTGYSFHWWNVGTSGAAKLNNSASKATTDSRPNKMWNFHNNDWLVVWNIFYFPIWFGNVIIPTDEIIFFRGVQTTNQMRI